MKNTVLQLCVNYGDSKFYSKIYSGLQSYYRIVAFSPLRSEKQMNNAKSWYDRKYVLNKKIIFNKLDRLWQRRKTQKYLDYVTEDLESFHDVRLIHAHSLFSDGSVALEIKKKFHTKYVVTIRNTDINVFWRWFIWRRRLGREIFKNAETIIVPSESYRKIVKSIFKDKNNKVVVIPNGVDETYFNHELNETKEFGKNLLFIGEFTYNKNILKLIDIMCRKPQWQLKIIGFGALQRHVIAKCRNTKNIEYCGHVSDVVEMIDYIDAADVIVIPAKTELFGIALAESISRGRPIVCMKGQGLYGFFDQFPIGEFLDKLESRQLFSALNQIRNNYSSYQQNCLKARYTFRWKGIIDVYAQEYEKAMSEQK